MVKGKCYRVILSCFRQIMEIRSVIEVSDRNMENEDINKLSRNDNHILQITVAYQKDNSPFELSAKKSKEKIHSIIARKSEDA